MAENKPAEVKISELSIENETLKNRVKEMQTQIDELNKTLKQANDVIEADIKSRVSQKIMAASKYTIEDLSKMSVDELKAIDNVLAMTSPAYKGIRSAGEEAKEQGLTVPSLFKFNKGGK